MPVYYDVLLWSNAAGKLIKRKCNTYAALLCIQTKQGTINNLHEVDMVWFLVECMLHYSPCLSRF